MCNFNDWNVKCCDGSPACCKTLVPYFVHTAFDILVNPQDIFNFIFVTMAMDDGEGY